MRILAIFVLCAALPHAATPQSVVVPLYENDRHPSIDVRINGKGPFRLLLDTGSGAALIVDDALAAELGLKSSGTRQIGDPNTPEALTAKIVAVDRVEIGGLVLRKVDAISWKRTPHDGADAPRGVAGLGLFGPRLVTLDYGHGELTIASGELPEADGRAILTATFEDGIPSLPIDVAGVLFRAHLDSGSTGFVGLPLDAVKKLPLEAPPVPVGRARTASGDYQVTESRLLGSLRVGDIVIDHPKVRFVDLPQANLGFDLLRSLVVTVDRANARVRLVSTGKPLEATERPRLGVMIHGPKDGVLPIEQVVPGSPAAAAGLRAGDQIVKLNGRPVAEMSGFELSQAMMTRPLSISLLRDGAPVEANVEAAPSPPR